MKHSVFIIYLHSNAKCIDFSKILIKNDENHTYIHAVENHQNTHTNEKLIIFIQIHEVPLVWRIYIYIYTHDLRTTDPDIKYLIISNVKSHGP